MRKESLQFNVIYRPEPEGGFTVLVPSLPGCISYGRDLKEAQMMALDAIKGYMESLKRHRDPMPSSDMQSFISTIRLSKNKTLNYA